MLNWYSTVINYIYSKVYDYFFGDVKFKLATPLLFYNSLKSIKKNKKILDFGIGNGICYEYDDIINIIKSNNLNITGIDIDPVYINKCKQRIIDTKLSDRVNVMLLDVFDYKIDNDDDKFDYILFSESAPLLSEELIIKIVNHINLNLLKKDGKIIFINNLTETNNKTLAVLKPLLKYLVMIDFGRVLKSSEFERLADELKKKIKINLIDSMKLTEMLNHFSLGWLYNICYFCGLEDYNIEQYEIILSSKN